MMTRFLISLADTVDHLLCDKKAVHLTSEMVEELDNLSGLDWDRAEYLVSPYDFHSVAPYNLEFGKRYSIYPFDLAYGWLKLSQAPIKEYDSGYGSGGFVGAHSTEIYRAAQYAELACLCMRMKLEYGNNQSCVSGPYSGNSYGATAAWEIIRRQLLNSNTYNPELSKIYSNELSLLKSS